MKIHSMTPINLVLTAALCCTWFSEANAQDNLTHAIGNGITSLDLRLRYEKVDQYGSDAHALTLRTLLGYTTAKYRGMSAMVEMEDTRIVLGTGDYTVGPAGYNLGVYSVIADPEHTELDQGYILYDSQLFSVKIGRQVLALDNQRFIGNVGWRQDRQTFDGFSAGFSPVKGLKLNYAYLTQRNRIFAQAADLNAKDHLFNAAYTTEFVTLTGYSYLLEVDNNTHNSLDTYGISLNGAAENDKFMLVYGLEYASQTNKIGTSEFSADYLMLEAGGEMNGIRGKIGYERLGSAHGKYGFATPLATLHKFNGWADLFLTTPVQGLVDVSLSVSAQATGGVWNAIYHDFSSDKVSADVDEFGNELDLSYERFFVDKFSLGVKYANFTGGGGAQDTDKLWLWVSAKF